MTLRRWGCGAIALLLCAASRVALAQVPPGVVCTTPTGGDANRPHPVCDVQAVVTRGPYLHAPTDSSAIITWMTDLPSRVMVEYGLSEPLTGRSYALSDGMAQVGTLHRVRLTGLRPGQRYQYRVVSTPVLELPAYWPKLGRESRSPAYAYTTCDARKATATFASISDTHESVGRIDTLMSRLDWSTLDFLVHTGDAFNGVTSESQVWDRWLSPLIRTGLRQETPLVFARGNHDTRGPFARDLARYVPIEEGRFYYARDVGPVHLLVIDTGEDKPDSTQVYAGLNAMEAYRAEELRWLKQHTATTPRIRSAPFRVAVMHQPRWGWGWLSPAADSARDEWIAAANDAGIDLVIAGHNHRFSLTERGAHGNAYPVLVVGQDQVAIVRATESTLHVRVVGKSGEEVSTFTVARRVR